MAPSYAVSRPAADDAGSAWTLGADWAARGLSYLVNPLLWPPLLFGLVPGHFGGAPAEVAYGALVGLVFFGLLPLGYVLWLRYRGRITSLEIPHRADRTRPLLFSLGSCLLAPGLLYTGTVSAAPLLATVGLLCALNTLLIVLINLRWKISLHLSSLAGFASILLFVAQTPWPERLGAAPLLQPLTLLYLLPILGLLMWARVRVRAHTWGQVLAGTAFGLAAPYAQLVCLWKAGLLAGF